MQDSRETFRQMNLPLYLPANDNDGRANWHEARMRKHTLAEFYLIEQWCKQNLATSHWEGYREWGWDVWRFQNAADFLMFELTWG